jgi:hypothetical protein
MVEVELYTLLPWQDMARTELMGTNRDYGALWNTTRRKVLMMDKKVNTTTSPHAFSLHPLSTSSGKRQSI